LPVQIGIDVTNSSLQRPGVSSQQNYLATQVSSSLLNAQQHAVGSEHAGRLVSVNAPED
jgi:hypothetical protein